MKRLKKIASDLKAKAHQLKTNSVALYFAYWNKSTPMFAKLSIAFTLVYLLSPIDLIPDFIPVLGYIDDLIILPMMISLSIKLIPSFVMIESRQKAEETRTRLQGNWLFAMPIVITWLMIGLLIAYFLA